MIGTPVTPGANPSGRDRARRWPWGKVVGPASTAAHPPPDATESRFDVKRLLTLLAVLGLLVTACGDDDSSSADDATSEQADGSDTTEADEDGGDAEGAAGKGGYAGALAADLREGGSFPGSEEQIDCLADGFVQSLGGPAELEAAGITPEELVASESPEDLGLDLDLEQVAADLVDTFEDCEFDLVELLIASSGTEAPEGFEECVREQVTNDELAQVFAQAIAAPDDAAAANDVVTRLQACSQPAGGEAPTTSGG